MTQRPEASEILTHCALVDAIERIDLVLLEIRQMQMNIIQNLRTPILYEALRYEESYIWGGYNDAAGGDGNDPENSWSKLFHKMQIDQKGIERLVWCWVIDFTELNGNLSDDGVNIGNHSTWSKYANLKWRQDLTRRIMKKIGTISHSGYWSADGRRYYHMLRSLQDIKSKILQDKIYVVKSAYEYFIGCRSHGNMSIKERRSIISRFYLTRSVSLGKLRGYLQHVGVLQDQLERTMDLSLHGDPRPTVDRRRDQGFFINYLADRSIELKRDIELLLDFAASPVPVTMTTERVMHNWAHDFAANVQKTSLIIDEIFNDEKKISTTYFVSSSFFMPDRPDLQPVLAHEVANVVIRDRYENLRQPLSDTRDDNFKRLTRGIYKIFSEIRGEIIPKMAPAQFSSNVDDDVFEISTDVVATSVSGYSYIYPLFMELVGKDLDILFEIIKGDPDIELAYSGKPVLPYDVSTLIVQPSWFYRLMVAAEYARSIETGAENNPYGKLLTEGVKSICRDLYMHVVEDLYERVDSAYIWDKVAITLVEAVKCSPFSEYVKEWRYRDYIYSQNAYMPSVKARKFNFSHIFKSRWREDTGIDNRFRHQKPLKMRIRRFLFEEMINMKTRHHRKLSGAVGSVLGKDGFSCSEKELHDIVVMFDDEYVFDHQGYKKGKSTRVLSNIVDDYLYKVPLFRCIEDICWQSSVISSVDFLGDRVGNRTLYEWKRPWLGYIHHSTAMGKELYQVGLELAFSETRSARDRSAVAIRVVECARQNPYLTSKGDPQIRKNLLDRLIVWLEGPANDGRENLSQKVSGVWSLIKNIICDLSQVEMLLLGDPHDKVKIKCLRNLVENVPSKAIHSVNSNNLPSEFYEWRFSGTNKRVSDVGNASTALIDNVINKFEGYKLAELEGILHEEFDNFDNPRDVFGDSLVELLGFLMLHRSEITCDEMRKYTKTNVQMNRDEKIEYILRTMRAVLCDEKKSHDVSLGEISSNGFGLRLFNISRFLLSGPLSDPNSLKEIASSDNDDFLLIRMSEESQWTDKSIRSANNAHSRGIDSWSGRYQPVLGRYDLIALEPCRPLFRSMLPYFHPGNNKDFEPSFKARIPEKFIPYIRRQELAIPFIVSPGSNSNAHIIEKYEGSHHLYAAIAVILVQRSARMDFLARMIMPHYCGKGVYDLKRNLNENEKRYTEGRLRGVTAASAAHMKEEDYAFIGEGWGDIIIFFGKKAGNGDYSIEAEDMNRVRYMQDAIYQDFLVNRTETVFMPTVISGVEDCGVKSFSVDVRLIEDRIGFGVNKSFEIKVASNIRKICSNGQLCVSNNAIEFHRLPGQMDYRIKCNVGGFRDWKHTGHEVWFAKVVEGVGHCIDFMTTNLEFPPLYE